MNGGNIIIEKINKKNNIFEVKYKVSDEIKEFFREDKFFMKYNESIEDIPEGILIIPFITNILPILWLTSSKIEVDELDKNFYESIENIRKGYENMYLEAKFFGGGGVVLVKKVIDYSYEATKKVCQLFSGGVDSTQTYISIHELQPDLITVWGSDMETKNEEGWQVVEKFVKDFGKENLVKNLIIKSNFKKVINEGNLNNKYMKLLKVNWWLGLHHGIALIGLAVPYAYKYKMKTIYVPGSFNKNDKNVRCASYPTIDEAVKYGSGKVIHDSFEYTRQDKIKIIADYIRSGKKVQLRVCWEEKDGKNCSCCEKCICTIVGLLLEDIDPNIAGFNIDKNEIKNIVFSQNIEFAKEEWIEFQEIIKNNIEKFKNEKWINWLLDINIDEWNKKAEENRRRKRKIRKYSRRALKIILIIIILHILKRTI